MALHQVLAGYIARNFARFNRNSPVTSGFTTGNGVDNNLPLVAVEVNGKLNSLEKSVIIMCNIAS